MRGVLRARRQGAGGPAPPELAPQTHGTCTACTLYARHVHVMCTSYARFMHGMHAACTVHVAQGVHCARAAWALQAGRASNRSNGIGLSTVRLAAAAAHGRAWLSSHLDSRGRDLVTFHCVLPVGDILPALLPQTAARGRTPAGTAADRGPAALATPLEAELMKTELAQLLPSPSASPSSSSAPSRAGSPSQRAPRPPPPLFCVGVDDDPVMLAYLAATFQQLGAARSRVLGTTIAEQLEAVDTILAIGPDRTDAITVAAAMLDLRLRHRARTPQSHVLKLRPLVPMQAATPCALCIMATARCTHVAVLDQHLHNQEHLPQLSRANMLHLAVPRIASMRHLRAFPAALGSMALPGGRGQATGNPSTAPGARASRLQRRRFTLHRSHPGRCSAPTSRRSSERKASLGSSCCTPARVHMTCVRSARPTHTHAHTHTRTHSHA